MKMNKKTTFDVEAVSKKRQLEIQSPVLRSRISGLVGYPRLFQGCEGGPSYWGCIAVVTQTEAITCSAAEN